MVSDRPELQVTWFQNTIFVWDQNLLKTRDVNCLETFPEFTNINSQEPGSVQYISDWVLIADTSPCSLFITDPYDLCCMRSLDLHLNHAVVHLCLCWTNYIACLVFINFVSQTLPDSIIHWTWNIHSTMQEFRLLLSVMQLCYISLCYIFQNIQTTHSLTYSLVSVLRNDPCKAQLTQALFA